MPSWMPLAGLSLALAACAHSPNPGPTATLPPPLQSRLGPAADFGPGIVDISSSDVDVQLNAAAYIIAFRVTRDLGVQLVAPLSGSPRSKPGVHYFRGSATSEIRSSAQLPAGVSSRPCTRRPDSRESCDDLASPYKITQLKQGAPPEAAGYWLLIVSDTPIPPHDILRQLETASLPDTSLDDLVRRIPVPLVASRTQRWAAYYAAFTRSGDQ